MACYTGNHDIRNIVNRIAGTCIFRQFVAVIISNTCFLIDNYIFHNCSKADSIPNLRLVFLA